MQNSTNKHKHKNNTSAKPTYRSSVADVIAVGLLAPSRSWSTGLEMTKSQDGTTKRRTTILIEHEISISTAAAAVVAVSSRCILLMDSDASVSQQRHQQQRFHRNYDHLSRQRYRCHPAHTTHLVRALPTQDVIEFGSAEAAAAFKTAAVIAAAATIQCINHQDSLRTLQPQQLFVVDAT